MPEIKFISQCIQLLTAVFITNFTLMATALTIPIVMGMIMMVMVTFFMDQEV